MCWHRLPCLPLLLVAIGCAGPPLPPASGDSPDVSAASPMIDVAAPTFQELVTAGAVFEPAQASSGQTLNLFVRLRVSDGYHIYALDNSGTDNIPTTIEVETGPDLIPTGAWEGPVPHSNSDGSQTLSGDLLFHRPYAVPKSATSVAPVAVSITYQACNEAVCWPPRTISLATAWKPLP